MSSGEWLLEWSRLTWCFPLHAGKGFQSSISLAIPLTSCQQLQHAHSDQMRVAGAAATVAALH